MTSLLDNELVRKYFGCPWGFGVPACEKEELLHVLTAMQKPIMAGERYLCHRAIEPNWFECAFAGEQLYQAAGFHPFALRLPDRFQCRCSVNDICAVHPERAVNRFQEGRRKCKCGSYQTKCPSCGEEHVFVIDYDAKPVIDKPQPTPEAKCEHGYAYWSECKACRQEAYEGKLKANIPYGPKPSEEKDKCFKCSDCGEENLTLWQHTYKHKNGKCQPSDAVEEKIAEIIHWVDDCKKLSRNDLRELVRLARESR